MVAMRMTMRANVDRQIDDTTTDPYTGAAEKKTGRIYNNLMCWVWESTRMSMNTRISPPLFIAESDVFMMVPLHTDIKAGDVITVTDRAGVTIWDDMHVDSVHPRTLYLQVKLVHVEQQSV